MQETKGAAALVARFMETLRPNHRLALQDPTHFSSKLAESDQGGAPKRTRVEAALSA